QHLRVVQLDPLVDLPLLDRGVHQPDHAEAVLVAALHGGLHVVGELLLEGHGGSWGWGARRRFRRNAKSRRRSRRGRLWLPCEVPGADGRELRRMRDQYSRWRLVTSREARRDWRFTAAAALRLRSWVGFS